MRTGNSEGLETIVPLVFQRRGSRRLADTGLPAYDTTIIEALGRALHWQHVLDTGALPSGSAIAGAEGLHKTLINELLHLTLLAPDIVERLMTGRQPRRLTLIWFMRNRIPADWEAQRQIIQGFE